jgi:hypothetical protein
MKQTFYLQEYNNGDILFTRNGERGELTGIGTITLDVEPIKKEVEKVIDANCIEDSTLHYVRVNQRIPVNAYNVKVTYTVKE